jgi:hypothetical protein
MSDHDEGQHRPGVHGEAEGLSDQVSEADTESNEEYELREPPGALPGSLAKCHANNPDQSAIRRLLRQFVAV